MKAHEHFKELKMNQIGDGDEIYESKRSNKSGFRIKLHKTEKAEKSDHSISFDQSNHFKPFDFEQGELHTSKHGKIMG